MKIKYLLPFLLLLINNYGIADENLPQDLNGQVFFFQVDSENSRQNPNANFIYIMHFKETTYRYQIMGSDKIVTGTYQYKHINEFDDIELAILNNTEDFDGVKTHYQMILLPKDQATGRYLFKQIEGAVQPNVRLNSARYTRLL